MIDLYTYHDFTSKYKVDGVNKVFTNLAEAEQCAKEKVKELGSVVYKNKKPYSMVIGKYGKIEIRKLYTNKE